MNFNGIIVGAAVFLSIGICHPAVIKMEYYLGKQSWWIWLVAGLGFSALSMFVENDTLSTIIGGLAFSCLWAIHEMFLQEKRIVWVTLCLLITMAVSAQEKRLLRGFDGGMMVHTGYLSGNLDAIGYKAQGAPMGIGGVIRLHLGDHFRIGSEGYVSTLSQRGNGSYLKYGWGGLLADYYTVLGRFQPYAGLTLGGGPMHLTLKVDYLCAVDKSKLLPDGPRVYIGFLFYHFRSPFPVIISPHDYVT